MAVSFPRYYVPRTYQRELHDMWRSKKIGVAVLPRQCGKDTAGSMEMAEARLRFPKTTGVYIAPDRPSIKNILWDKSYFDPVAQKHINMLQDNIPEELVQKFRETTLEVRFTNKSILKLEGYFQSGKGENGVGTAFQDYFFTELSLFTREDPIPRLLPIITSENEGEDKRLMAVATPRGKRENSLWKLMKDVENRKDSQVIIRTIEDLNEMQRREGLPPVRTQEQLEIDREMYLRRFGNSRMFEQEFYVSFEEMDAAAVYGEALSNLISNGRNQPFELNPGHPVYVVFDIGASGYQSDATAWIAFQWYNNKIFIYDAGEGHGKALPEYVDVLQTKPWFNKLAYIILPWDAEHHEKAVRTTPADMMRERFPNVAVLARGTNIWTVRGMPNTNDSDIITMVQQVRMALYNTYINGLGEDRDNLRNLTRPNADLVLECMENYKYAYDNRKQEWTPYPVHDKYSHIMDALRYLVQATLEMDFFGGQPFDTHAKQTTDSYKQDWADAW